MQLIIYFFSNFLLIFSGFILIMPLTVKTREEMIVINKYITAGVLRLIIGAFCFIFSIAKLVIPYKGVLIFGDIIPALMLLVSAVTMLMGYIHLSKLLTSEEIEKGVDILRRLEIPIGFICIIIALIHIFVPSLLFL